MSDWLRVAVTVAMLAFVFVGYFTSTEPAWRDARALLSALLRFRRAAAPAPRAEAGRLAAEPVRNGVSGP
jgi:hypothetical protein